MKKKLAFLSLSLLFALPFGGLTAAQRASYVVGKHHHHHHHHSSSSVAEKLIGTFSIIGFAEHSSPQLSNEVIYEPVNKRYKTEVSKDWNLGDSVTVVRSEHKHIYVLTDLSTGQVIKCKVLHIK